MKLKKVNMFATPSNQEEIGNMIEAMPAECRAVGYTCCMMMWNYAVEMSDKPEPENENG